MGRGVRVITVSFYKHSTKAQTWVNDSCEYMCQLCVPLSHLKEYLPTVKQTEYIGHTLSIHTHNMYHVYMQLPSTHEVHHS